MKPSTFYTLLGGLCGFAGIIALTIASSQPLDIKTKLLTLILGSIPLILASIALAIAEVKALEEKTMKKEAKK